MGKMLPQAVQLQEWPLLLGGSSETHPQHSRRIPCWRPFPVLNGGHCDVHMASEAVAPGRSTGGLTSRLPSSTSVTAHACAVPSEALPEHVPCDRPRRFVL